jgi:DNA-binding MurR/RpiR family transcriptional regulator
VAGKIRPVDAPADGGVKAVERALAANYDRLSSGQRRVIDHLLADTRYAAIVSAPVLAQELGISESLVTRTAQALGFSGYPDLRSRLQEHFVGGVPERMETTTAELGDDPASAALRAMYQDAENVRQTAEDLPPESLAAAVSALLGARRVYLFGTRGSSGLATMLGIGLRLLLPDVRILTQTAGDLPDQLVGLSESDAVVGITFRRTDRATVAVLRWARQIGAETIVITDHRSSPAARQAEHALIVRAGSPHLLPSFAAGASLANALVVATLLQTKGTSATLEGMEHLWASFETHEDWANVTGDTGTGQTEDSGSRGAKGVMLSEAKHLGSATARPPKAEILRPAGSE